MKFIKKLFLCLLVASLLVANVFSITSFAATPQEVPLDTVTLQDVMAGLATLSQVSGPTARSLSVDSVLTDGTYYLNGEYSGDYLKYNSNSSYPSAESGTFSALGSKIKWKITNVGGSFTIQPLNNLTKYLAVSSTGTDAQYTTVSGTTIPEECLWNISFAANGGCLVQNVGNSRYLCTSGSTVSTIDSLGSSSSAAYKSCVWRIAEVSFISGRELDEDSYFSTLTLAVGNTGSPLMTKTPTNAVWATPGDFTYSLQVASYVSESNGVFSANTAGVTTVIATHKVTDYKFVFAVIAGTKPLFTIQNYIDQGYRLRFNDDDCSNVIDYNTIVNAKFEQFFGLTCSSVYTMHTSSADTCTIAQYGSVTSDHLEITCPHSPTHLTGANNFDALRNAMGNGTIYSSRVLWTGYILPGNPPSESNASRYSVVLKPQYTTIYDDQEETYTNKSAEEVRKESIFELMHELSHQLGAFDHYCYDEDNPNGCENPECDEHIYDLPDPRQCIMSYRRDVEAYDESILYCSSCIAIINNHLTDHHQ